MTIDALLKAIQALPLAGYVRGDVAGTEWIFPIIETCHVLALVVVFGSIAMVDLRLLGLYARDAPVTQLASSLLRWTWTAWCFAALFGSLLFMSNAAVYGNNRQFIGKFVCMGLAGLNMLYFQFWTFKGVSKWDSAEPPPAAKWAGALSLLLWTGVVVLGRWTGFTI
jgi:hypothetical protein